MLDRDAIANHPNIGAILKDQASCFLAVVEARPKVPATFGTQQRYLLTQLAMAMVFESKGRGLLLTHYLDAVQQYRIASRNTAQAFIQQMLHYGMGVMGETGKDRRARPLLLTRPPIEALEQWMSVHLSSLDRVDGGTRADIFQQNPALLEIIHPLLVRQVLSLKTTMEPQGAFSLFTWMNDGGLLMDKMICSLNDEYRGQAQVPTSICSFDELCSGLRVTRTHISRKMLEAENAGYVGWTGKRGLSQLWVSATFIEEYETYQIDKLATIELALAQTLASSSKKCYQ